jgi:ferredoxin
MKHYKKLASLLLSIFSLSLLTGCTNSASNKEKNTNNNEEKLKKQDSSNTDSINANDNIKLEPMDSNAPELKISSSCIGCGQCVKTDPAHFDFNNNTGKAIVASQDNLDTSNLKQAVNNCLASAISL